MPVPLRYELAISLRYFRSRRAEGAVSFITWIAVGGVSLGVGALIVAMSVMNGYQTNLIRAMAGALPHVSLHALLEGAIPARETLDPLLIESLHPSTISPYVLYETLLSGPRSSQGSMRGVLMRAIDPEVESTVPGLLAFLDDGTPRWSTLEPSERQEQAAVLLRSLGKPVAPGVSPVLLSPVLARKLGVRLGDRLVPLEFPKGGGGFSPIPTAQRLQVAGFFSTGIMAFDELVVLMDIGQVDAIFPGKNHQKALGMRLSDPLRASEAADWLRAEMRRQNRSIYVYSWLEENRGLFRVIQFQKTTLFLVLMLIVLLAFFGMTGALVMLVAEKSREIAILRSLGARKRSILSVFVMQGLLIGVVGTLLGVLLGLAACWMLATLPMFSIPAGVYPGSDRVPVLVAGSDVVMVVSATFFTCLVATLFPAFKATALKPVAGLRGG